MGGSGGGGPKGWGPEPKKSGAQRGGGPEGWGPKQLGPEGWGAQNFALFFLSLPPEISFFLPSLRVPAFKTPPKFNEKTPREIRKNEIFGGREKKRSEILCGPGEGRSGGGGSGGEAQKS